MIILMRFLVVEKWENFEVSELYRMSQKVSAYDQQSNLGLLLD